MAGPEQHSGGRDAQARKPLREPLPAKLPGHERGQQDRATGGQRGQEAQRRQLALAADVRQPSDPDHEWAAVHRPPRELGRLLEVVELVAVVAVAPRHGHQHGDDRSGDSADRWQRERRSSGVPGGRAAWGSRARRAEEACRCPLHSDRPWLFVGLVSASVAWMDPPIDARRLRRAPARGLGDSVDPVSSLI